MVCLCVPLLVFVAAFTRFAEADFEDDSTVVKTSYGPIQGEKFVSSWTNKTIYAFRGIPYASPPTGDLRFKDPVPPKKWKLMKDCTTDQSMCLQVVDPILDQFDFSFNMSEDCLYLNVYKPQLQPGSELLPVMVWVHGGAFTQGASSYFFWGPDFLVGEGVVFVSLNYRLGALGFMTLGTPDIAGNMGLKDQNFALRWVKKEIHRFGGDPKKVTLVGESAGSTSVHLHYLSPWSKGLFRGVIGESGTALATWSIRDNGELYGRLFAEALNCTTSDPFSLRKCLLTADSGAIITAQDMVKPSVEDAENGMNLVFIPIIDNCSLQPFLPDHPLQLLEQGQGSFVPFIMGTNSDEGILALFSSTEERIKNITNNLEFFIPLAVRKHSTKSRVKLMAEKIKEFYFQDKKNVRGFINLYTDVMFGYSTAVSARLFRQRERVYLYYFSFNGAFKETPTRYIEKKLNISGVSHAEELGYIFVEQKVNQTAPDDSKEMKTWRRMVKMWTNFAKYGSPTIGMDPELQNIKWAPIGNRTTNYLHIDEDLTMTKSDYLAHTVSLWDSIIPSSSAHLRTSILIYPTLASVHFIIRQ